MRFVGRRITLEAICDVGRVVPGQGDVTVVSERSSVRSQLEPLVVNARLRISALWVSMLFVFLYVDLFSLYRPDVRADLEAGELGGFTVGQGFLLGITAYVVIPSLMVFGTLVLPPQACRVANIGLAALYALTIIAGAVDERSQVYYVAGSVVEVALLVGVVYYAWCWPRASTASGDRG
jgi:hypothetical protein